LLPVMRYVTLEFRT